MEFKCQICGEPFIEQGDGKYEVYEILGKWTCSRACAIERLYNDGDLVVGTKSGDVCKKCGGATFKSDEDKGLTFRGVPYCSDICLNLDLIDTGQLTIFRGCNN